MSTFVVCHDAWEGGWAWQDVGRALAARGHAVHRPSLTGLGERRHLGHPGIDLSAHRQDILELLIFEELQDVVLVGHGYGAMVAAGVADDAPERVALLVLLDPFLPRRGQSFLDLFAGTPIAEQLVGEAKAYGDGWRVASPVPPTDVRAADQPLGTLQEGLRLRHPPRVQRVGIACSRREPLPLYAPVAGACQELRAQDVPLREILCGHRAPGEAPEELAALLDDLAAGVTGRLARKE